MAYTIEATVKALKEKFKLSKFEPITLNMKCNGDAVVITAESHNKLEKIEDAVYFIVDSPRLPYLGGDTLEDIAKQLNNYANLVKKNEEEKVKLAKYYEEHLKNANKRTKAYKENFSFYSDWYKDVYGARPKK